jgi:ketosteroid isomerase-like protein
VTLDLATLADRIAIEECIFHYAHLLDSLQFDRIAAEIFTEDANVDFGGANVAGRSNIHAQVMGYREAMTGCSHNITNLVIVVEGDEARATARVMAWHWFAKPDADRFAETDLLAIGGYEDRLRRTPDGWRIFRRRGFNCGTGVGIGVVPEPMRPNFDGMAGRIPAWPLG